MINIKTIFIALTLTVLLCMGVILGLKMFTRSIYNQRTCDWANIDNIELHTQIDIPDILTYDCFYKGERNTKMARFDLDLNNLDMINYIHQNKFTRLTKPTEFFFDKFLNININADELLSNRNLYYTYGSSRQENWQALLDNVAGKLWVTIEYAN